MSSSPAKHRPANKIWSEFVTRTNRAVQLDVDGDVCEGLYGFRPFTACATPDGSGLFVGVDTLQRPYFKVWDEPGVRFYKLKPGAGVFAAAGIDDASATKGPFDLHALLAEPWVLKVAQPLLPKSGLAAPSWRVRGSGAPCAACHKAAATKHCKQCRIASYCSVECQRAHWRKGHKVVCRKFDPASKPERPLTPAQRFLDDMCAKIDKKTAELRIVLRNEYLEAVVAGAPGPNGTVKDACKISDAMAECWNSWSETQRVQCLQMIAANFWRSLSGTDWLFTLADHITHHDFDPVQDQKIDFFKQFLAALCIWDPKLVSQPASAVLKCLRVAASGEENKPGNPEYEQFLAKVAKWQKAWDGTTTAKQLGTWYIEDFIGEPDRLAMELKLWTSLRSLCEVGGKCVGLARTLGTGMGAIEDIESAYDRLDEEERREEEEEENFKLEKPVQFGQKQLTS